MTPEVLASSSPELDARLAELGVVMIECDPDGREPRAADGHEWLERLLRDAPAMTEAIETAVRRWRDQGPPPTEELVPGLWLAPVCRGRPRRPRSWRLAVIVGPRLLLSQHLRASCRAAGIDFEDCRRALEKLRPVSDAEIHRVAALVAEIVREDVRHATDRQALDSLGQQLAESYEEVTLLYSTVRAMCEVEQPERFLEDACRQLLDVLPYAWVGVAMRDDEARLRRLAGRFFAAGAVSIDDDDVREAALALAESASPEQPIVLEPEASHPMRPLGRMVVAQPITSDGEVLGLLVAGEKQGRDEAASSSDLKLIAATAGHAAIFIENAGLYEDLGAMAVGTLEALTAAIDAKDPYTCGHSRRVALLTEQLADAAGLDPHRVARARIAGLVHDVGKIGVPEVVLTKPGRLTDHEFDLVKLHPEIGHRILRDIPNLEDVLPGVLHHHERWDGRGYPHGLAGEDIPLVARLIGLADAFDAMSSTRTYRSRLVRSEVLTEIERGIGTQFDPMLAPIFLRLDFGEFDRMIREQSRLDLEADEISVRGRAA